jgi:hypothetical protein
LNMANLEPNQEVINKNVEEFHYAVRHNLNAWVPACGGTEVPFRARSGAVLLYCFNPKLQKHAYINVETDIILEDNDAFLHLGLR